jgi:hypothetical protein
MRANESVRQIITSIAPGLEDVFTPPPRAPLIPFRIQFATSTVKPLALPDFPYVSTRLTFDSVVYTAIVLGTDLDDATKRIRAFWPKAEPHEATMGTNAFEFADSHLPSVQFGALQASPKRGFWSRHFGRKG